MKKLFQISIVAASVLISGVSSAKDNMGMTCDQPQKMMEKRMEMMRSSLKLDAKQEKAFNAFAKEKKSLMKDMMEHKHAGMKGKGMNHNNDMHGGKMDSVQDKHSMQAQQGMRGKMGMMGIMSDLSFEERMTFMQKHAEKMTATSKAGKKFFNSLSAEQKKKLNDMARNMKGMSGKKGMNMK